MHGNKSSFSGIIKAAVIIALPVLLLFWYNHSGIEIQLGGISLKKISGEEAPELDGLSPDSSGNTTASADTGFVPLPDSGAKLSQIDSLPGLVRKDSLKPDSAGSSTYGNSVSSPDSAKTLQKVQETGIASKADSGSQRILLIGDSQAGGIMYALNDYCEENGHRLVGVFSWFSATCLNFGYSGRIENLIQTFRPSLIVVVLGLNELHARDIKSRQKAARMMQEKFGNTPYLWVGPANYMKDYGINKAFEEVAGPGKFFLSRDIQLPRAKDKRHPSQNGYKIWMDSIASFVQDNNQYSFPFNRPQKTGRRIKARVITANAAKNREY